MPDAGCGTSGLPWHTARLHYPVPTCGFPNIRLQNRLKGKHEKEHKKIRLGKAIRVAISRLAIKPAPIEPGDCQDVQHFLRETRSSISIVHKKCPIAGSGGQSGGVAAHSLWESEMDDCYDRETAEGGSEKWQITRFRESCQ